MIADLQWTEHQVNWQYDNKKIEINVEAVFFATIVKDGNLICIQSGKNYIEEKIYFYNYDGEFVLSYDLEEKIINWIYLNKKAICSVPGLNQAMYNKDTEHILILYDNKVVRTMASNGEVLCENNAPNGYICKYLSWIEGKPVVVCDGDENHQDKFGRFRVNFYINEKNMTSEKGNIAY